MNVFDLAVFKAELCFAELVYIFGTPCASFSLK